MYSKHEMLIMVLLWRTLKYEYVYGVFLLYYGHVYVLGMCIKDFKLT